jgi:hypothetical protein
MIYFRCPKCEGVMEKGFLRPPLHNRTVQWVEGDPNWTGVFNWPGRRKIPIRALRCVACGYLELYAPGERKKTNEDGV